MDADAQPEASVSFDDVDTTRSEFGSSKVDSIIGVISNGDLNGELGSSEDFLTRIELDLACTSEKLCNLNIFMMHVATKESELETLDTWKEEDWCHLVEISMEFDLLSSFLESEVRELDNVMDTLKRDIIDAHRVINPNDLETSDSAMEEKLHDSVKTLEQLQEQLNELHEQSTMFQKALSAFHREDSGETEKDVGLVENGQSSDLDAKSKLQTAEQQRHFLRMLEKSLARELDLEKKVTETKQIEEELKLRLQSTEQEVFFLEEEMCDTLERLFQADNFAETLMGISKELLGRLQISHFNLNSSLQREAELRLKLEDSTEKLKAKESDLQKLESTSKELNDSLKTTLMGVEAKLTLANTEVSTLKDTISTLEKQIQESESQMTNVKTSNADMENAIEGLKERLYKAESRAESAEAQCKQLTDKNTELSKELGILKASGISAEKVDSLERRLRDSDNLLQHAVASAEASEEKQKMLYSAIKDMEHIIEDLKLKVGKAEFRADSAEDNCIRLSEANAELSEELSFLRGRMESLESSLHRAEEIKLATAKDISIHTKVMANLVMQLAIERERLHKQMSSLAKDNKILVIKLHQTSKDAIALKSHDSKRNGGEVVSSAQEFPAPAIVTARDSKEKASECSETLTKAETDTTTAPATETDPIPTDSASQVEVARRIDAGVLSFKLLLVAALIVLLATSTQFF